jgi:hypothetical protein
MLTASRDRNGWGGNYFVPIGEMWHSHLFSVVTI